MENISAAPLTIRLGHYHHSDPHSQEHEPYPELAIPRYLVVPQSTHRQQHRLVTCVARSVLSCHGDPHVPDANDHKPGCGVLEKSRYQDNQRQMTTENLYFQYRSTAIRLCQKIFYLLLLMHLGK